MDEVARLGGQQGGLLPTADVHHVPASGVEGATRRQRRETRDRARDGLKSPTADFVEPGERVHQPDRVRVQGPNEERLRGRVFDDPARVHDGYVVRHFGNDA